jgi:hypothetical protein
MDGVPWDLLVGLGVEVEVGVLEAVLLVGAVVLGFMA